VADELLRPDGRYGARHGVNWLGVGAWALGVIAYLGITGKLAGVGLAGLPAAGASLPSLAVAFGAYLALARVAPRALEARAGAWVGEKQSVRFVLSPSALRIRSALTPSLVVGSLTTTLDAIFASSRPCWTMPSTSVATTSRLTTPSTMRQISSTRSRKGRFSLA